MNFWVYFWRSLFREKAILLGCVIVVFDDAVKEEVPGGAEELIRATSWIERLKLVVHEGHQLWVGDKGGVINSVGLWLKNHFSIVFTYRQKVDIFSLPCRDVILSVNGRNSFVEGDEELDWTKWRSDVIEKEKRDLHKRK